MLFSRMAEVVAGKTVISADFRRLFKKEMILVF